MGKLALSVLAVAWWICVGAGAVYFLTYKATPAPAAKVKQTLRVEESKVLGPGEELRVIWLPSSVDVIGNRCLLYTKDQTATMTCAPTDISPE